MTPKEQANRLVDLFWRNTILQMSLPDSKRCALIMVNEIVQALVNYGADSNELQNMDSELRHWENVTQEIKNIK